MVVLDWVICDDVWIVCEWRLVGVAGVAGEGGW